MSEAGEGRGWIGGEGLVVQGIRSTHSLRGVAPRGDHAFLSEEAVQGVAEGGEERRVQGPITELRLTHALQ